VTAERQKIIRSFRETSKNKTRREETKSEDLTKSQGGGENASDGTRRTVSLHKAYLLREVLEYPRNEEGRGGLLDPFRRKTGKKERGDSTGFGLVLGQVSEDVHQTE